jgi:hypothetical protein
MMLIQFLVGTDLPQGIHTSTVAFQFVDNVQIIHPLLVTVDAPDVGVFPTMLPNFPLEQAIIHCVLHLALTQQIAGLVEVVDERARLGR